MGRALGLWGPVAAWMAVLFVLSAQPSVPDAFTAMPDWSSHGIAYLLLSVLACRALAGGFGRPIKLGQALAAIALATLYGMSDEYHQSFVPARRADVADVVKDFGGAALGALLYRRFSVRPVRGESA